MSTYTQDTPSTRRLKQLLAAWQTAVAHTPHPSPPPYHGPDVALTHLTEKTGDVAPGAAFIARVRAGSDGHPYIGRAIEAGASLILAQRAPEEVGLTVPDGVVYWQVADTAETLAWLAAAWEGFPSRQLVVVGVTGTDGKTSVCNLAFASLRAAGLRVGLLSTIKAVIGDEEEPLELHVTTPEAPVVQRYLRRMVDAGLTHCVLEVTSHSLPQHRVTAVHFDIAAVTNITHEHLDYHGGYAEYVAAKARLFEQVAKRTASENLYKVQVRPTAVLNRDDSSYERLAAISVPHTLTYALHQPAAVTATDIMYTARETRFTLQLNEVGGSNTAVPVTSSLVGEFNIYNMLAAAAIATALGIAPSQIQVGLEGVQAISGRMERIDRGQPFLTIVDFAHTPNALAKAIEAARGMTDGRIITVFGSAGKRDVEKRRLMAEVSAQAADLTVLTAEDPRTESLDAILAFMAEGCRRQGGVEGETFWRVPDRGEAIYFALTLARPEDLVLVCGKGHEQSMCFGVVEYPWDDREATHAALDAFLQERPMPNLGLPTYEA
jgi:UDP-N-acetylmuramoyl-L-alanyl-D-glutamate--2,6-diaminopimelate ligase